MTDLDATYLNNDVVRDEARDITFTPYVKDGRVGYRVERPGHTTEYLYFNPTDDSSDTSSGDIFVYHGHSGDPAIDGSVVYLNVVQDISTTDDRDVIEVHDVAAYEAEHGTVVATCGACGRSWDDSHATAWTPAPAARCPFEDEH